MFSYPFGHTTGRTLFFVIIHTFGVYLFGSGPLSPKYSDSLKKLCVFGDLLNLYIYILYTMRNIEELFLLFVVYTALVLNTS